MNKKILIAILVIVAVSIAGTVVLNASMPKETILVPTQTGASINSGLSGHYDSESGLYYVEGTLQNTGNKDAKNVTLETILYQLSSSPNDQEIKRETANFGVIPAETSKDVNFTISIAKDLGEVRGQWNTTWEVA